MTVHVVFVGSAASWTSSVRLGCCCDTPTMLTAFASLWPADLPGTPLRVGATLSELTKNSCTAPSLFADDRLSEDTGW